MGRCAVLHSGVRAPMGRGPGRCLAVWGMSARRGRSIRVVEQVGGIGAAGRGGDTRMVEARARWGGGIGTGAWRGGGKRAASPRDLTGHALEDH